MRATPTSWWFRPAGAVTPGRRARRRLGQCLPPAAHAVGGPVDPLGDPARVPFGGLCRRVGAPLSGAAEHAFRRIGLDLHLDEAQVGVAAPLSAAAFRVTPPLVLPTIATIVFAPVWRRRSRRRRDEQGLAADLPVVIELFRLAVAAGSSLHQALPAVAGRAPPRFRDALDDVIAREAIGEPLADALGCLGDLGAIVGPLAAALAAAERDGSALGGRLDRLAAEARLGHRRRAEEAARRLPVQLLFPLVGCVLPAFGLLTVVPLLAASMPHLS